jgi:hypothetical protein
MTVATNTIQNVARVGVREDLSDKIAQLFPDETPFINAAGRTKANNTYHEWQNDVLAAANAANASIQGDDLSNLSRANTTRVGNYTQIFTKVVGSSTTVEWTKKAGRKSELARELMKAGRELQTDIEARATGNLPSVAPASGTAGLFGGALAWLTSNTSKGAGGADGGFSAGVVAAATNGTQRSYTENLLKPVLQSIWLKGGAPKMVITNGVQKQNEATFAGLAQQRRETNNKRITIVAGADAYVSDFGVLQFVPDRFASTRDALIVDPEYVNLAIGEAVTPFDLAQTGLAKRKALRTELTLEVTHEGALGAVRDLS